MRANDICHYFDGEIVVDESQYEAGLVVETNSYEANVEIPMIKVVEDNDGRNADEQYWYEIMQNPQYLDERYTYRVLLGYYIYDDGDELYYNVGANIYERIFAKYDYENPPINTKIVIEMNKNSMHKNIKIGHLIIYSLTDRVFLNTNSDPNIKYIVLDGVKTSTNQCGGFYNNNVERIELVNVDKYVPMENSPGMQSTFRDMPMLRSFPKIDTFKARLLTAAYANCPQASGELELDYSSITLINYGMPTFTSTSLNKLAVSPCNKIEGTYIDVDGNIITTAYQNAFNVKSLFELFLTKIAWGNLNISNAIQLTKESLLYCLNELIPTTPDKPKIFKIGQINLNKLSEVEIKLATDKNWILTA